MPPVIAIVGPTASGKSRLAMALAGEMDGELVNADALQVYRGLDLGTAKPSVADRAAVRHHLIDVVDPGERYSAGRFATEARAILEAIRRRDKRPILVGGSGLYLRALLDGIGEIPEVEPEVVTELAQRLARRLCPDCKVPHEAEPEVLRDIGFTEEQIASAKLLRGAGCRTCGETGYKGRVALYEVMPMTDGLKDMVLQGCSTTELKEQMMRDGIWTLRMSGIAKALQGVTTIDEVTRTTAADRV